MHPLRLVAPSLILACLALLAAPASAQTIIAGGNIANQTWTTAGSPYRINGDITIPAGTYLQIEPGVVIDVATSDGLGSGTNTSEVEIIVRGALRVLGSAASPVTIRGTGSGADAWWGISVESEASEAIIQHATIEEATYAIRSSVPGTGLVLSDTTLHTSGYGLYLMGGAPSVQRVTVHGCAYRGVYVGASAGLTLTSSLVRNNSGYGVEVVQDAGTTADTVLRQVTVYSNVSRGVSVTASGTRAVRVLDSIVSSNGTYGVYRTGSATVEVSNTNAWGQSTNLSGVITGTGNLSANPLYVSTGATPNLRLTSNSPCRFASSTSGDIGALPYTSDATPQLVGTLWESRTLTAAESPYTVPGDLTVAPAVVLTIQPGVTLRFATSDLMGSGENTSESELRVFGRVMAVGAEGQEIVFDGAGSGADAWYGVRLYGTGSSTFDRVSIGEASYALYQASPASHTLQRSTLHTSGYGLYVAAGAMVADAITVHGCAYRGVYVLASAGLTLTSSLVRNNSGYGVEVVQDAGTTADTVLRQVTVYSNVSRGVSVTASGTRAVRVLDSIVSSNGTYGVYRTGSATVEVSNTNAWGQSTNLSGVITGTGNLSANPLYVSTGATPNLRLTSNSPCRFASSTSGDIGALPYTSDATPQLVGTLWESRTLTAAESPYTVPGDLTVAPAVVLTIQPGVTLRFATSDLMGSGENTSESELRVFGRVMAVGAEGQEIVFDGAGSGADAWYGVRLYGTGSSTFDRVSIGEASYALYQASPASHTLQRSTLHTSGYGLYVAAGAMVADAITVHGCAYRGVYVGASAGLTLSNAVIRSNSGYGMEVVQDASSTLHTLLLSSTVYGNVSRGLSITASGARSVRVFNSIVSSNGTYGVYRTGSATVEVATSNVWGQSTNLSGVITASGNLSANPLYVAAPADLRLTATSPCIDAASATMSPDHDRNGVVRPLDGNGFGGAQYDMGAYEFPYMVVCGNGVLETGEACDSGASNGMYGHCNATCTGLGPRCGDSMTNGPEQCDDGNTSNTDACLNSCLLPTCGDGHVRAGVEQCDDGNTSTTDACIMCVSARCGDGYLQTGVEACDDGNTSNTDACLGTCVAATCGDGFVRLGVETCDDGNTMDGDACPSTCILGASTCGNGIVESGEECDDGNSITTDACVSCTAARCGDGHVRAGFEQCDDANTSQTDGCLNTCAFARCGDGFTQAGVEACDDGNASNTDACLNTCVMASCGDSYVHAGVEACDDGNTSNTDACLATCALASCGDGHVRSGFEQCDDGNTIQTDGCLNSCALARCGDGFTQAGVEACDDGNTSNDDACLNSCAAATCGDGYVRAGVEDCDDGNTLNTDLCVGACRIATCGDGYVRTGVEACDDGNASDTDACVMCEAARCGDGYVQAGVEGCDDGNRVDTDACPNSCMAPGCGDGVVQAGEACDDGNTSNEDGCLVGCTLPSCGDGYVHVGVEDCDDGNTMETDSCLTSCEAAICGDGHVWEGMEDCDDGNASDTDACVGECVSAACGDGYVQAGVEGCDDGNTDDGDGCSASCELETPELDGGMPDAGLAPDAGSGMEDASVNLPDGGMRADAGSVTPRGGCGCRVGGGPSTAPVGWLLALSLLALRRRRR